MLYMLHPLADQFPVFNVFRYLTFRTGGAVITALIVAFVFGPMIINRLKTRLQPIRSDGPESHLITKQGTPTMGGILILLGLFISTLLWADLSNGYVWITLFVTGGYGFIGFLDDYLKVKAKSSGGLSGKLKLLGQIGIAILASYWATKLMPMGMETHLAFPFFKGLLVDLGWMFIAVAAFVMVGASNSVNLTDGLDGLAIVPVMIAAGVFALIAYLTGNAVFANYLQIHHVPGTGELAVFCGALIGAGLGFLWFNAPRPWCLWAIPAPWPWAGRSAQSASSPNTKSSSPSSAVCSFWKPFR